LAATDCPTDPEPRTASVLKKLRNKLLLVNAVTLSVLMLAAFTTVFVLTRSNALAEVDRKLDQMPVVSLDGSNGPVLFGPGLSANAGTRVPGDPGGQGSALPLDYSASFSAILYEDSQVIAVLTRLNLPEDTYDQAIQNAWSANKETGSLAFEGRVWQYKVTPLNYRQVMFDDQGMHFVRGDDIYQINFLDVTDTMSSLASLLVTFSIASVVMLGLLFAVSFFFANRSIRPIEVSWNKQKQFVADASHELKTPLSIIGANVDVLQANAELTVGSQRKWIDYIRAEIDRMSKLINDLLYLAHSEDSQGNPQRFDLGKLIAEADTAMEVMIYEKGLQFSEDIAPGVYVQADAASIKQAVIILLDNAMKYNMLAGWITISLSKDNGQALVTVRNSGPGIPAADLPRVFDRFYRPDAARSTANGSYGLGLSIACAIIERAGGKISASSADGITEFSFSLRLA